MKRINTAANEYNAIRVDTPLSATELSELEQIVAKENQLSWIEFTYQQTTDVWKEINKIIVAHNPMLQLSFSQGKDWGEWVNLSFLEYLPDLQRLIINEWLLQDLSPIANLTKLKRILIHNKFKSAKPTLKPLCTLENLEDFYSSHIKDIETISCFKKLKKLSLDAVKTSSLDFLKENTLLETIWLRGSDTIKDFSGLSFLPNLKKAHFIRNYKYEDLNFIAALVNMEYLYVSDFNQVREVPSLKLLTKLTDLTIKDCKQLTDFSKIAEAKNLEDVSCSTTKEMLPQHFEFLGLNTKLKRIYVNFCNEEKNKEFNTIRDNILNKNYA